MAGYVLSIVSQKGGVGKSTLARLLARQMAGKSDGVIIADLDRAQQTSVKWQQRRQEAGISPPITVLRARAEEIGQLADCYKFVIADSPPHSSTDTLRTARAANVVLLPTGLAIDDLEPSVLLAHELIRQGVAPNTLAFALCRVGDRETEIEDAREYLSLAGYLVLRGEIPERTAYRRASDSGRTLTETPFQSLNQRAERLGTSILKHLWSAI